MTDFTDYADAAKRLYGVHGGIAADVWPHGARVTCEKCGASQRITTAQCAAYLKRGWPKCCENTMRLEAKPKP